VRDRTKLTLAVSVGIFTLTAFVFYLVLKTYLGMT